MVSFKLCISDPSTGRTFQKEVKDAQAAQLIGLNLGETIKGDAFELGGYELLITGGSDYCGFPMRRGILGLRKSMAIYGGIGFRGAGKGIKKRKTVCGHKIHERISQVNLKVVKHGAKKLNEIFGVAEEAKKEEKAEAREEKKEKKAKEEHKAEEKKEHKQAKEHKEEKRDEATHQAEENKHEKSKEHKGEKKESVEK